VALYVPVCSVYLNPKWIGSCKYMIYTKSFRCVYSLCMSYYIFTGHTQCHKLEVSITKCSNNFNFINQVFYVRYFNYILTIRFLKVIKSHTFLHINVFNNRASTDCGTLHIIPYLPKSKVTLI
jgi:hypothetical protein